MPQTKPNSTSQKERAARMSPAARRDQLIMCAVRVFARFGIGNAGHAQVADEAGVSTPTVFLYMPNRQALIDCVLSEIDRYLEELIAEAASRSSTASGKLLAVTRAFAHAIDTDPDYVKVFLNWGAVVHEETWPQYVDFQDRILGLLESIIDEGIERGQIPANVNSIWGAHLVMGSANMIAQMKFRGRDQSEINSFLSALVRGALPRNV
ncbi:MAG: TetR/AcrR family hemagglutinin/protease transcriptional regulator [Gammaproteobacteria bacterium]|jgi:TetR/AcrR family hemagglutinin/protease transcriptional regulator